MTDEAAPLSFGEWFEGLDDAQIASWSCHSLVQSLLRPEKDESQSLTAAIEAARKMIASGAEGLLRRAAAIDETDARLQAFADIEQVIEGTLRLASGISEPAVVHLLQRRPGRPQKVDDETIRLEVFRLMDHHGDFSSDDDWNAQARLEETIATKFSISPTRVRARIREPLDEWRHSKRGL